jgi:hypothetical protein
MNRAAHILGLSASLWACDLCFASHALAGTEPIEVLPPADDAKPQARPEPPRGRALYGAGIFGVTFGIFNIGYGIPLSITGPGDAYFSGYIPIAFGASFIALGAVGIHYGKRRRKTWRAWQEDPTAPPPVYERRPSHLAWLVVGGVTVPFGLATIGVMIPNFTDPVLNTPSFAYGVTAWGAASVVAGVAMLTVGSVEARRRVRRGREARLELTPTSWARRDGFGFGVAGRF